MSRAFQQVDVFTAEPYRGNPVAVVLDADGISDDEMQRFASWTNLSETTFVLTPTDPSADYRVRIFTPTSELPFAGHPTIGTCHAWLGAGGSPMAENIVQECGVGLVPLRRDGDRLAFAAPPLARGGEVGDEYVDQVCTALGLSRDDIVAAQWADNGPGWIAVMLKSDEAVLALEPDFGVVESSGNGIVGPYPIGVVGKSSNSETAIEVRAFFTAAGTAIEDPVTGSLNAALAQWLLAEGAAGSQVGLTAPYVAAQGTAIGRAGRVYIDEADGEIWVGGGAVAAITGQVEL